MAESILGLLFEISADPRKAQEALASLKASTVAESTEISASLKATSDGLGSLGADADAFTAGVTKGTGEAVKGLGKMEGELLSNREGARLLSETLGLHLPRAITTAISNVKGLDSALGAAVPVALGLFAAIEAPKALISLGKMIQGTEEIARAWKEAAANIKQADDELGQLDIQHRNVQRELSEMGLSEASANRLKVLYAENDVKLAKQEADDAKSALDRAREHLGVLEAQHAVSMGIASLAGLQLSNTTSEIEVQKAGISDLSEKLEVAQSKARKAADDLALLNKSIEVGDEKTAKGAIGGVHHLTKWLERASVVLPNVNADLLRLNVTAQELGQTLHTSFEVGLIPGSGNTDPFGVFASSLHKTIETLPVANQLLAEMTNVLPGPQVRALTQEFSTLRGALKSWSEQAKVDVGSVSADFQHLNNIGGQAFDSLNKGMNSAIVNALVYKESWGKAMAEVLKSSLASIASEAGVRALQATALGLYDLALTPPNVPGATAAFESAAIWGSIAAGSGLGARAIGGGGVGGGSVGSGIGSRGGAGGSGSDASGPVATWDAAAGGAASGSRGNTPYGTVIAVGSREFAQLVGAALMQHAHNGGQLPQNPHPQYVTPGNSR